MPSQGFDISPNHFRGFPDTLTRGGNAGLAQKIPAGIQMPGEIFFQSRINSMEIRLGRSTHLGHSDLLDE
jgi:hypothetical protein